jgi:hypothetical protein
LKRSKSGNGRGEIRDPGITHPIAFKKPSVGGEANHDIMLLVLDVLYLS